uniref:Uncharacterized protein n=1 Tax=Steinernema glaseri TaxID=37863 RepID=A0A1I7Z6H5_9BILA
MAPVAQTCNQIAKAALPPRLRGSQRDSPPPPLAPLPFVIARDLRSRRAKPPLNALRSFFRLPTVRDMQPIRALLLLLVALVGFVAAAPMDIQWRDAGSRYPSRRAQMLIKRREEKALRNCFFSPVQCLLPINDKAFRKFVPQN